MNSITKTDLFFDDNIWVRNFRLEAELNNQGIEFELIWVSTDDINWKVSEKNTGKIGVPVDKGRVDSMVTSIESGIPLPVTAVWKNGDGEYVVWAGMHRLTSRVRVAGEAALVPVIFTAGTSSESDARELGIMDNRLEGPGYSPEEAIRAAVYIILTTGKSATELSKKFKVSSAAINVHLRSKRVHDALATEGMRLKIPVARASILARLLSMPMVLCRAASAVDQPGVTIDQAKDLVNLLTSNVYKTESKKLTAIEEWDQVINPDQKKTSTGGIDRNRKSRKASAKFVVPMLSLTAFAKSINYSPEKAMLDEEDRDRFKNESKQLIKFIKSVLTETD